MVDLMMKYLLFALFWIIWCTVHSGMISVKTTNYLKRRFESNFHFYRLFFNLVSIATLIPVILWSIYKKPRNILLGGVPDLIAGFRCDKLHVIWGLNPTGKAHLEEIRKTL